MPILLSALTFVSTAIGGALALRMKGSLRYFFAFSAGTLLAIALTDLLPEAIEASASGSGYRAAVFYVVLGSFLLFHVTERYVLIHHVSDIECQAPTTQAEHLHPHAVGGLGASGLVVHSVLDGVAIGAAFQASSTVGAVVALAVIAHDFADGVNTVTLTRRVSASDRRAAAFLVADAAAPVVGALATLVVTIPGPWLALALAFFVGHFLYIAAADLIPAMHAGKPSLSVFATHMAGIGAIIVLEQIISS